MLNIRFNDLHSSASLTEHLHAALRAEEARYEMRVDCSGESFLTQPGPFVDALRRAVVRATGQEPALDTGGGTSDARFIARFCPVAELGAVGVDHAQGERGGAGGGAARPRRAVSHGARGGLRLSSTRPSTPPPRTRGIIAAGLRGAFRLAQGKPDGLLLIEDFARWRRPAASGRRRSACPASWR